MQRADRTQEVLDSRLVPADRGRGGKAAAYCSHQDLAFWTLNSSTCPHASHDMTFTDTTRPAAPISVERRTATVPARSSPPRLYVLMELPRRTCYVRRGARPAMDCTPWEPIVISCGKRRLGLMFAIRVDPSRILRRHVRGSLDSNRRDLINLCRCENLMVITSVTTKSATESVVD